MSAGRRAGRGRATTGARDTDPHSPPAGARGGAEPHRQGVGAAANARGRSRPHRSGESCAGGRPPRARPDRRTVPPGRIRGTGGRGGGLGALRMRDALVRASASNSVPLGKTKRGGGGGLRQGNDPKDAL